MAKSKTEIVLAAEKAHNALRVYCMGLGDYAHSAWSEASKKERDASIAKVKSLTKMELETPQDRVFHSTAKESLEG